MSMSTYHSFPPRKAVVHKVSTVLGSVVSYHICANDGYSSSSLILQTVVSTRRGGTFNMACMPPDKC